MGFLSDASSSFIGAAAVVLGDSSGEALRVMAVSSGDGVEEFSTGTAMEISDHLGSFLDAFLPTVVGSLAAASGSESVGSGEAGLAGSVQELAGAGLLRLVLPQGGDGLGGLDPTTTVLQHLGEGGSLSALFPSISSSEMASLARTGSGPMLVTLLAIEAGIEQILDKLREIEGKVDQILKGMERERTARMRGTVAYLSDITGTIRSGNLDSDSTTTFSGELENTDREARGFSEEYRAMLRESLEEFEKLDIAGANLDIEDDVKAIRAAVTKVEDAAQGLLLSLSVRMITMRVRSLLPIEQESTRQRVERLNREIDELLESVKRTGEISKEKGGEIHGLRQEIVQKTGSVFGGAGRFAGKVLKGETLGGKIAVGLTKGAAGLVGEAAKSAGRFLEGAAGVEGAQRSLTEEFNSFESEIIEAIEGVRKDGHIVEKMREKSISGTSKVVLDLSVGEDGKVYVRG